MNDEQRTRFNIMYASLVQRKQEVTSSHTPVLCKNCGESIYQREDGFWFHSSSFFLYCNNANTFAGEAGPKIDANELRAV